MQKIIYVGWGNWYWDENTLLLLSLSSSLRSGIYHFTFNPYPANVENMVSS